MSVENEGTTTVETAAPETQGVSTATQPVDDVVAGLWNEKYPESTTPDATEGGDAKPSEAETSKGVRARDEKGRFVPVNQPTEGTEDATPAVEQPTEVTAPKFSDSLIREAEHVGLTAAEAMEFGSEKALQRYVETARRAAQPPQPSVQQQPTAPTKQTPPAQSSDLQFPAEPEEWQDDSLLTAAERYQRDAFRSMKAAFEGQQAALEQARLSAEQEQQRRDSAEVDSFVKELGEDFRLVYGDGDYRTLDVNSPYRRERANLYRAAQHLGDLMPDAPLAQRLDAAMRVMHRQRYDQQLQKRYADGLKKQALSRSGPTATTTVTRSAPTNGPASQDPNIIAAFTAMLHEQGA